MLEPVDAPGGLVVAGMGGSAIGGALARAALGDQASRPIVVTRSYGLPAWTSPEVTVLLSSYSGDTEETLGVLRGRRRRWAPAASSSPRAASSPIRPAPTRCRSSRCRAACSRAAPSPT